MIRMLRSIFGSAEIRTTDAVSTPPVELTVAGSSAFPVIHHLYSHEGMAMLDWDAAHAWTLSIGDEQKGIEAWHLCENAWLQHLALSLGPQYRLDEYKDALLVSSLPEGNARSVLRYIDRTLHRIIELLDGVAREPVVGRDVLIVLDDHDTYYRYVSQYYPEDGEFSTSAGMYIHSACPHFVTVKDDLRVIEPTIAHELTHRCLSHLPIPAWLNEGLAVNTEYQLSPPPSQQFTPAELHQKHLEFWGADEIQQFWSGKSFQRSDEGNLLSYDLARIIVSQFAKDWPRFRAFANAAQLGDAGAAAAGEHIHVDLGVIACALMEREYDRSWAPNPTSWLEGSERGGFRAVVP